MATYTFKIITNSPVDVLTRFLLKLVGKDGESENTSFTWTAIIPRPEITGTLTCSNSLGKLELVQLVKQSVLPPKLDWFVHMIEVTAPEGQVFKFPIHHWLTEGLDYHFREGTAVREFEEYHPLAKYSRNKELMLRKEEFIWDKYADGLPYCMKADNPVDLPPEVRFSFTKDIQFKFTAAYALAAMNLTHLIGRTDPWKSFDDINDAFVRSKTEMAEYVKEHWKEDAFFGSQFLNGLNPILIRRCTSLPSNFPVTDDMLALEGGASLADELKDGNIFLCDYKNLDGVKTNVINDKPQYLAAPLVLLHKTPNDELKPVAIQLLQTPADNNPIYLPSDPEYDWLLAKTFVRSADFNEYELNVHLLRTHLLAEVFTVSLLRNIPRVHPLYKLLMPHTRYNLQINVLARQSLISETGIFTKFASSGGEGANTILKRSLSSVSYRSLCLPEDILDRGVESVPNYYYRDDGLKLWNVIQSFVSEVLRHYYKSDNEVQDDKELQDYIRDIFEYGFLSNSTSGIPQSFSTVDELVKFATMVMFNSSVQHAGVNHGQLDMGAWIPNLPITLQCPPPIKKGEATEDTLLNTLSDVNASVNGLAVLWLLTKQSTDFVPLGQFPCERFTEDIPNKLISNLQIELAKLDLEIFTRNRLMVDDGKFPYIYLKPEKIENSVAI